MNIKQKYKEYKLARADEKAVRQKLDTAMMKISCFVDINSCTLPKCINFVRSDGMCLYSSEGCIVRQDCKSFDNDTDCKKCRYRYKKQNLHVRNL